LLGTERNEEATWWLLAALVERICFPGTFNAALSGCHVEMRALQGLLDEKLPRLAVHMREQGVDISFLATDWWGREGATGGRCGDGRFRGRPARWCRACAATGS
jgi:hypothetical protein